MTQTQLYPTPQNPHEWSGYIGPVNVGPYEAGLHPKRTLLASIAATALATSIYAGAQIDSPTGPTFEISYSTNQTYTTSNQHSEINIEENTITIPGESTVVQTPRKEITKVLRKDTLGNMPDVISFDLDTTPDSQIILNKGELDDLLLEVETSFKDGWSINGITLEGLSSDEARVKGEDAGIGVSDEENKILSEQYGAFIQKSAIERAKELGVTFPQNLIIDTSREVVLDSDQINEFEKIRDDAGFTTNLEFLNVYKFEPETLSDTSKSAVKTLLDRNRGASIEVALSKTIPGETVYTSQATLSTWEKTERCVTDNTRMIIDTVITTEHDPIIPLVPLLLPIGKIRRREDFISKTSPTKQPTVTPVEVEAVNHPGSSRKLERRAKEHDAIYPREGETYRSQTFLDRRSTYFRSERKRTIIKNAVAGAFGLLALLSVRLDAGYCPDISKHQEQSYDLFGGQSGFLFPDSLHVRLQLPFTDIKTDQLLLYANPCDSPNSTATTPPSPAPEPVCDTRTSIYRNGILVEETETHYPGAITTTHGTGKPK